MLVLDAATVLSPSPVYTLHITDSAGPWTYPEHTHNGFGDLLVVERGSIRQRINGQDISLAAGEAILVRPADRHAVGGAGFRFYNLNIPAGEFARLAAYAGDDLAMDALLTARQAPRARLSVPDRQRMLADLAELIARQGGAGSRTVLGRFLLRWLPAFLGRPSGASAGAGPAWLDPLLRRIDEGVARLTAADLPRLAGVSQAHLSRSFRRHVGTSPSQHLNRVRLHRAALELARSERPVLDIGYGLGFASPSYFYRLFARAYGLPPAAYRRRHRMLRVP